MLLSNYILSYFICNWIFFLNILTKLLIRYSQRLFLPNFTIVVLYEIMKVSPGLAINPSVTANQVRTMRMVQEHVMAGKKTLKNTAIYSVSYVRVKPNRSARWQHIERYSQRILFTRVIYVCRYISEQKATFGRGPDVGGGGGGEGEDTHTGARPRTHGWRATSVCIEPASAPTERLPTRRILIIMKGETLFVGQELNL